MEKIEKMFMEIKDILDKWNMFNFNLNYQRNADAWPKKTKAIFIDSILNDYFIPDVLVRSNNNSQYDVLDGKTTLKQYINFIVLNNITEEKLKDTFLWINSGSIKLNKNEFIFAKAHGKNKNWIKDL